MRVKTLIMATSAAGALALSAGAAAAEPNGWYGAIDAGNHTLGDVETVSQTGGAAFNIGTEGQMYVGGLGLTVAMLALDAKLPAILLIPAAIACSMLFGAMWAYLPGYLQARRGSHIVVTTIMFNFIAASLMNFVIVKYLIPEGEQNTSSRNFSEAGSMPRLGEWIPNFADAPLNLSFLLAIAALAVYGIVVWRSPWGYKALAGLAAVNSIMGSTHYLSLSFPAGAGFVGIAIALMGRQHPVGIFLSSVLFGALIQGGGELSFQKPAIPPETFIFIQGLIILFCGAMENLYAPALLRLINVGRR